MRLVSFKAQNYRSLKNFELELEKFLVIVGENNSGKSTILRALELFLSSNVKGISDESFYNYDVTSPIILTACFDSLSKKEDEELKQWLVDGKLIVKKEYKRDSGKTEVKYFAVTSIPKEDWLREDYKDYSDRNKITTLPIKEFIPSSGRITKGIYNDAIKNYIEKYRNSVKFVPIERENPTGYKQVLDYYLPEFYLLPAVRDVSEEVKTTSSALLGKLISIISKKVISSNPKKFEEFQKKIKELSTVIEGETPDKKLQEIKDFETQLQKALSDWDVKVEIRVKSPDLATIMQSGIHVILNDGFATSIEEKGNGLQRSMIFALMRVWADISRSEKEKKNNEAGEHSIIFAFEEPELYLHPHICRATYQALRKLSDVHQILLCTHSAHFVNMEDYKDIVIIRKLNQKDGTTSCKVSGELFEKTQIKKRFDMIQFFNPDRSEVFFAKHVALVEGATEKALIPLLARRLNKFDYRASIIDCGGKGNLLLYMKVLNAFKIPYVALYDEDPIPNDIKPGQKNYDQEKYNACKSAFELNAKIEKECDHKISMTHMFRGKLEDITRISKSHAEKVGKPYAAIEKYSDDKIEIPRDLQDAIDKIYMY